MANEVRYSGLADLRLTETLSSQVIRLLADRKALMNHPALMYIGDVGGGESLTKKVSEIGWDGYDAMSDVAEGSSVVNSALTDASATVTVSRRAKSYIFSDLAQMTDVQGILTRPGFARDAAISAQMKLTNLIANVTDDFTATVGTTTVDMDADDLVSAAITLQIANAEIESGLLAILHSRQWGDVHLDLMTTAAGAVQWAPATQEQLAVTGNGFKGRFFGMDIFVSNQVPTANSGADRAGALFTRGAVAWADATPTTGGSPFKAVLGKLLLAEEYDVGSSETTLAMNYYCGVSQVIDAAGVSIITDA